MSKLAGYTEEDKTMVKTLMEIFVGAAVMRGDIGKKDDAVKDAMPKAFEASKSYVDTVNHEVTRFSHIDSSDLTRTLHISAKLFAGAVTNNEIKYDADSAAIVAFSKKMFRESLQVTNAVNELLCG